MPRERQDSGGYHRGRGSHACPASIRPTHPVVTNRSSPHYAEALAGGCSAPTTPTPWPRSIGSRRTVVIARHSLGRTPVGGAGFRRQRISGGRACRKQQTGGQWNDIRRAHRAGRRRPVLLTWAGVELRSPSFGDYQPIPARHAKDHDNLSPALEWSGVPQEAAEPAVLCEDPTPPRHLHPLGAGRAPPDRDRPGRGRASRRDCAAITPRPRSGWYPGLRRSVGLACS
jgi:hypothetical protein